MVESFVFVGNEFVGQIFSDRLTQAGFNEVDEVEYADAVIVYCEAQNLLEDIFFETKGIISQASEGTHLVNLSPTTPGFAQELNSVALVSGLNVAEAPLVMQDFTKERAFDKENLSCFFAFEGKDADEILPLLRTLVNQVEATQTPGSAELARAAITIQLAAEVVSYIEIHALHRVLSVSSEPALRLASSQGLLSRQAVNLIEAVATERFKGDFTLNFWIADIVAALMTADDADLILPGTEACMHLLELLVVIGGMSMTPAALSLVYADEEKCTKYGLDWAKAEDEYGEGGHAHDHDHNHDHDHDCDCGHSHDDFGPDFGAYSSN